MNKYKKGNRIKDMLIWLPSIPIITFFPQNAFEKIFFSDQLDKVISNSTILVLTGIVLLIATALFLYRKTVALGTSILACYMIMIVGIHISKGKPYFIASFIVLLIVFAGYLRKPKVAHLELNRV